MPRLAVSELLHLDVGPDGFHRDTIAVPEVVPKIEFVEVERDVE